MKKVDSNFYPKKILEKDYVEFKNIISKIGNNHELIEFIKKSGVLINSKHIKYDELEDYIYNLLTQREDEEVSKFLNEVKLLKDYSISLSNEIETILKALSLTIFDYIEYINKEFIDKISIDFESYDIVCEMFPRMLGLLLMRYNHLFSRNKIFSDKKVSMEMIELLNYLVNLEVILDEYIYTWMLNGAEIVKKNNKILINENAQSRDFIITRETHLDFLQTKELSIAINNFSLEENQLSKTDIKEFLKESFYNCDDLYFQGVLLDYWIEFWIELQDVANTKKIYIQKSKKQWIDILSKNISKDVVCRIFDYFIFNDRSIDLFDSPFIKIDDKYLIIPIFIINTNPSEALFSLFRVNGMKELNKKGIRFEKSILKVLNTNKIQCFGQCIAHTKNDTYEIDGGFLLKNTLFIIEAKTLKVPKDFPSYIGVNEALEEYYMKFLRNFNYFVNNKSKELSQKLKVNQDKIKHIIPLFISNIPVKETMKYDKILITDIYAFESYFYKRPMQRIILNQMSKELDIYQAGREYLSNNYSDDTFIPFVMENYTYEMNKSIIKKRNYPINHDLSLNRYEFVKTINNS